MYCIYKCLIDTNGNNLRDIPLKIKTDSQYTVDCITKWYEKFKIRRFKNDRGLV